MPSWIDFIDTKLEIVKRLNELEKKRNWGFKKKNGRNEKKIKWDE